MKKILLILGIISVFSCSPKEEKKSNSITVMIPDWAVPTEQMLASFNEQTGIEVTINVVSWDDIRDKISIAAIAGTAAADVVEVDWSWIGEFNAANWLEPIDISEEDIAAMPSITPFVVDSNVYALPYANDFRLAYYNKVQFKNAGIDKEPQTWDEVYQNMKTIKEKNIVKYPLSIPLSATEPTTTVLIWLALSKYGVVFNDDNTLNKEAILGSLEFINNAVNVDKLVDPANTTSSGMDAYRKITSGEASFIAGPTSFVGRINDPKETSVLGQIDAILLPGANAPSEKTFALPEGLGVLKMSENKEAAMEFVKWFNSPEIQKELNYAQNTIPTRTTVLEEIIDIGKLKNTGALLEESKRIVSVFPNGVPVYYAVMSSHIFNTINEMVLGMKTPQEAFDYMDNAVNKLIKENS